MKEKIAKWYKQRLWTKAMVKNAVKKGVLTAGDYTEIVGEANEKHLHLLRGGHPRGADGLPNL